LKRRFDDLMWLTFLDLCDAPCACSGVSKSKATDLLDFLPDRFQIL
jgi:hypothetical protein